MSGREDLLIKVSKLYYYEKLNQKEIAKKLFLSRSKVSKLLEEARKSGIVQVQINDPFTYEKELALSLCKKYNLKDVFVMKSENATGNIGNQLTEFINDLIISDTYVGVSSGKTLFQLSSTMEIRKKNLVFVPLLAGESYFANGWNANDNAQRFAYRFNQKALVLNSPLLIRSVLLRDEIIKDPLIKPVVDAFDKCDTILMGIGEISEDSSLGQTELTRSEIIDAGENGAKAIFCATFVGGDGKAIEGKNFDHFMGAKITNLKKCEKVIGIATGMKKVEAIRAVLNSGVLHYLCTSDDVAKKLLER